MLSNTEYFKIITRKNFDDYLLFIIILIIYVEYLKYTFIFYYMLIIQSKLMLKIKKE